MVDAQLSGLDSHGEAEWSGADDEKGYIQRWVYLSRDNRFGSDEYRFFTLGVKSYGCPNLV
jgi:hypothetical protein